MSPFGIRPEERVAIFIDGPNFHASSRNVGIDMDFKSLREHLASKSRLIRAFYFTAISEGEEFSPARPLVDYLSFNGYSTVTKPLKEATDNEGRKRVKGNMNVDIACAALEIADRLDHVIFCSGDGELVPLIETLKRRGIRTTVVSSHKGESPSISDEMRRVTDNYVDVSDVLEIVTRKPTGPVVERRPLSVRPRT